MRYLAFFGTLVATTIPNPCLGADNQNVKLAMHVVAASDSLGCDDLIPSDCDSINVDVSVAEILASDGYGYILFLAYDADALSGSEFAVTGWPTGRGAPPKEGPYWCGDNPLSLGDIFDDGEIVAFGECAVAGTDGMVPLGYLFFGPLDESDLPISVSYDTSTYSYPDSGLNYVLGCAPDFLEHPILAHSGCTIGGTYSGSLPDCPTADGKEKPLAGFMGPRVQRARTSGAWVNLKGQHVDEETEVYLRYDTAQRRDARQVFLGDGVYVYKAATTVADTGWWSVVVSNGPGKTTALENVLLLVPSLVKYRAARCGNDYLPGVVSVKLRDGVLSLPGNAGSGTPGEVTLDSDELARILREHSVTRIERTFKGRTPGLRWGEDINGNPILLSDLSQFYQLRLPSHIDPADVATDLEILPEVKQVWLGRPVTLFADTLEPNDYYYAEVPETDPYYQWAPRKIGCPEAWFRETCSEDTILISIIENQGVYYEHEDLGDSEGPLDFPNDKVVGGYDFAQGDPYPQPPSDPDNDHGTKVAGVAGASTNNTVGIAGVGWDAKLLAYKHDASPGQAARAIDSSRVDGAHIINMSWGYNGCDTLDIEPGFAELRAAVHNASWAGLVLVAAGGNLFADLPPCPAAYKEVIGVGEVGEGDVVVMGSCHGPHIDIVAPSGVVTTDTPSENSYSLFYGTSAATPHVAGSAALLQARADSLFGSFYYGEDIRGLICACADPAGSPAGDSIPNEYAGWGRINVAKAMERLEDPYNDGHGPTLLSAAGVDTYYVSGDAFCFTDSSISYLRYRCLRWAGFDGVYADSFAWGMYRFDTNGALPSPCDEDEMYWPFCESVPQSMAQWRCLLQSYVYLKVVDGGTPEADTSWVPCAPESLRWSYRVSGKRLTTLVEPQPEWAVESVLMQNYPNPFNPNTAISFWLAKRQRVTMKIYGVSGRLVRTLVEEILGTGSHRIVWDGLDGSGIPVPSGVYFCRLETPRVAQTKKLVLLR